MIQIKNSRTQLLFLPRENNPKISMVFIEPVPFGKGSVRCIVITHMNGTSSPMRIWRC